MPACVCVHSWWIYFVHTGIVCELFIFDFVYVVLMDLFVDKMVAASMKL